MRHWIGLGLGLALAANAGWAAESALAPAKDAETNGGYVNAGRPADGPATPAEAAFKRPPDRKPSKDYVDVAVPGSANRHGDSVDPSALKGCQIVSLHVGEARVRLAAGGERILKPGDVVGTDVVKSVDATRLVLTRTGGGGEDLIIVTRDPQGRTRVRVYLSKNPDTRATGALR